MPDIYPIGVLYLSVLQNTQIQREYILVTITNLSLEFLIASKSKGIYFSG